VTFRPVIDWLAERTTGDALADRNVIPLALSFMFGVLAGLAVAGIA